jgi:hypothetical protein
MPSGEDQARIYPAVSRAFTVSVLLLLTEIQRGHAQLGQRQRCLGCLGLHLTTDKLAPDSLELLPDMQLGVVKVNLILGQAEDFTPSQTEDEDQDEGPIERFAGMPGRQQQTAVTT